MINERRKQAFRFLSLASVLALGACSSPGTRSADPTGESTADELQGTLQLYIINYEDGSAVEQYFLETAAGQTFELEFAQRPAVATGEIVAVQGVEVGERRIQVQSYRVLSDDDVVSVGQSLVGNTVRTRSKLAVLMVHWSAPDAQTAATMRDKVFTSTTSTKAFYNENSYGLFSLEGDVFGWFQIPTPSGCDTSAIATNARNAVAAAGVTLSNYNQFLYYFPRTTSCAWSGLAMLGRPTSPARDTWYNGSSGCVVLAQELLHNFGARHSHSYTCSGGPIAAPGSCTFSEYGDPYDPMGSGCFQVNVYQKAAQGWFAQCNNVTVTSNGTFDIAPTELASNGVQSLRIPMSSGLCPNGWTTCYYMVENRQPVGLFDSRSPTAQVFQGVMVHVASTVSFSGQATPTGPYLLDMSPGSSSGFRDSALVVGGTFQDPNGTRISLVSKDSTSARVKVEFPGGGSGAPICIDGTQFGGTPPPPPPTCAAGEAAFNGHCYVRTTVAESFDAALTRCRSRGTGWSLAQVSSAEENNFVSGIIGTSESWLGGTDRTTEGTFLWLSGSTFWSGGATGAAVGGSYTNFVIGEPNDGGGNSDCLRMVAGGGWRDITCTNPFVAVCESNTN